MQPESVLNDIISGDDAFRQYFRVSFPLYCNYCYFKFSFDDDECREIVQEAFIRLWVNRERLPKDLLVRAWMYKTIVNYGLNILKHEKSKEKYRKYLLQNKGNNAGADPYHGADSAQLQADISKAIAALPEQMRIIFQLSREEGLTYTQIADRLQLSVKTIETQMSRALQKLRNSLQKHLGLLLILITVRWLS